MFVYVLEVFGVDKVSEGWEEEELQKLISLVCAAGGGAEMRP